MSDRGREPVSDRGRKPLSHRDLESLPHRAVGPAMTGLQALLMDVRPLRASADFRRLWLAGIFSGMGSQLASFAVLFYVWRLTGSVVWTGMVGLARMLPMLAAALVGGALADSRDRRRLVMVTRSGQIVTAALLTVDSATGGQLWAVLLLVGLQSGLGTVGAPASKTFVPKLLPPRLVSAGIALFMISFQASMLIGPSVAGLIVAQWGVTVCFAIDTVTFAGSLYGVLRLPPMPPEAPAHGDRPRGGLRAVGEGMALVVRTPVVRAAMLADLVATVPAMPISLFPLVNAERFGDNPRTLGLFMTALAVGGVLATAFSGTYTRLNRQVVVMLVSVAVWGGALLAFGLVSALWATLLTLAVAGAADSTSVVSRGTVVQLAVPDRVRGRVNSLDYLVGVAGPELGNVRGGLVAGATSGSVATIIGGGMAALGAGLIALLVPVALRFSAVPAEPGHEADCEPSEDGAPEPGKNAPCEPGDGADPDPGRLAEPVAAPANPQRR